MIIEPTGLAAPGDMLGDVVDHCPSVDAIRVLTLVLTVNVIVFGVEEQALPGIVTGAWSRATASETAWRR